MISIALQLGRIRAAFAVLLRWCGVLAGFVTFAMMLLVVANAVLRYAINVPVTGALEITEAMLCVLIFLSLALTQYEGGHIHVTLLVKRLRPRVRKLLGLAAMLFGFAFFAWCSSATWQFAMKSLALGEQEWGAIQFPIYPIKFVVFFGILLLAVQFLLDAAAIACGIESGRKEPLPEEVSIDAGGRL